MEHLMLDPDRHQELERRVKALEEEVETLRSILNDLLKPNQHASTPPDQVDPPEEDDGDWYCSHGHGD